MERAMGNRPYSSVHTMDAEDSTGTSMMTKAAFGVGGVVLGGLVAHFLSGKMGSDDATTETETDEATA